MRFSISCCSRRRNGKNYNEGIMKRTICFFFEIQNHRLLIIIIGYENFASQHIRDHIYWIMIIWQKGHNQFHLHTYSINQSFNQSINQSVSEPANQHDYRRSRERKRNTIRSMKNERCRSVSVSFWFPAKSCDHKNKEQKRREINMENRKEWPFAMDLAAEK